MGRELRGMILLLIGMSLFPAAGCNRSTSRTTLRISIETTQPKPLPKGLSGFNVQLFASGVEPWDEDLLDRTTELAPGFIRVPGGAVTLAYDWRIGNLRREWVELLHVEEHPLTHWKNRQYKRLFHMEKKVRGKGYYTLRDMARMARKLASPLVYTANVRTDTPESLGALARYTVEEGIRIAHWELCGEPFSWAYPGKPVQFWMDGKDYIENMSFYAQAIRKEIPDAEISIGFSFGDPQWKQEAFDQAIANYNPKFWDDFSFHWYPARGKETLEEAIPAVIEALETKTTQLIDHYFLPLNAPLNPGVSITEFNSSGKGEYVRSLFSGLHAAEYLLRLSDHPNIKRIGYHQLFLHALNRKNAYDWTVWKAGHANPPEVLDTQNMDFGWYETVPAIALRIVNPILNGSREWFETEVRDLRNRKEKRQSTVARAFRLRDGREALIVSNRSGKEEKIEIYRDGKRFAGPFLVQSMGGTDPARLNSGEISDMDVELREEAGTIKVPPYGVICVRWETKEENAPSIPQNLKADPAPGGVNLSWDPVPGVTAYRVLYGVTPERWVRESVVTEGSTFQVEDLEPGNDYAFSVTAIGSEGESRPAPTQIEKAAEKYRYAPLSSIPAQAGTVFWIPSLSWKNPEVVVEFQYDPEVTITSPLKLLAREDLTGDSFALGCSPVPGGQEVQLLLERIENGSVTPLAESGPLALKPGQWNQLRFELDEAVLRGWLNDHLVVATQLDPTLEINPGKSGVLSPEAGVELRNFAVR